MPVFTMPALFLAHSAKDGRGGFSARGMVTGRVRGRAGLLSGSVSVAVFMMRGGCGGRAGCQMGRIFVWGFREDGCDFTRDWWWLY